jgi:glycine cleavage system H protein
MDEFSYSNIFETKGIEYLIIIAFLCLIIPFWIIINKQKTIKMQAKKASGVLSDNLLRIPRGLFFSKNHTWTHLQRSGNAMVGLDDFLLHVTGEIKFRSFKKQDDFIKRGDLIAEIVHNGKILKITSPLSGKIVSTNSKLKFNPGILNEDPYIKGWIYKIDPTSWIEETSSYFLAEEAVAWTKRELIRLKDFLAESMNKYSPETSPLVLQDGGELSGQPLAELPNEVWQDFQKTFLN